MISARWTWWWFIACVTLLLGGLGWASIQALGFEEREILARHEAMNRQTLRLTLWKMESSLAPMLAREFGRTSDDYRPFRWIDRDSGVKVASPLLRAPSPPVLLHFEIDAATDEISSPQVPFSDRDEALNVYTTEYDIAVAERRLRQVAERIRAEFPDFGAFAQRPFTNSADVADADQYPSDRDPFEKSLEDFARREKRVPAMHDLSRNRFRQPLRLRPLPNDLSNLDPRRMCPTFERSGSDPGMVRCW